MDKRRIDGNLRLLRLNLSDSLDFCSNDYLGFARSAELAGAIEKQVGFQKSLVNGATGSRLLSGNSLLAEELEEAVANFHKAECGLIFNSGYDANLGLFSCIASRSDTILYDELSHASIIDGVRLSTAHAFKFRHNDLEHLEALMKKASGTIYVGVESVYSMSGDFSPLSQILGLCEKYHALLIVDEAHATGVFGEKGKGRVVELGLEKKVFARVHTFGKALGVHGAIILGSEELRTFLINFSRPFIYSTALPPHSLIAVQCAYHFLNAQEGRINMLRERIVFFKEKAGLLKSLLFEESFSAIQCVIIKGNVKVKALAGSIQSRGYDVRPILSPTVASGSECIRICLHTFNTFEQIQGLLNEIESFCL